VTGTSDGIVLANSLDNVLTGSSKGADQLFGLAGNDTLNSDAYGSNTTLIGGTGNDTITGSYYSDTYVFNSGDGQDTISDYSAGYANTDTLKFGAGIAAGDVTPVRSGLDLVFKLANGSDQITVKNWFTDSSRNMYQIEQVKFEDGTTWTNDQINTRALEVAGTAGDDVLTGVNAFTDVLHGNAGKDTLNAVGSGDTLDGGAGNDTLNADAYGSNMTLIGGTGNDTITGSYYSDTYVFNSGDGQDTISDYSAGYVNTDTLKFGAGIAAGDVTPVRSGLDLVFKLANGSDQITVKNWFTDSSRNMYQIEQVKFADGTTWSSAQVNAQALEVIGTSAADVLTGVSAFADVLRGGDGNDTLNAVGGGDTLDGGAGNDKLNADYWGGGTTFIGGAGNDVSTGSYYGDTYVFNRGDGQDTIVESGPSYNADTLSLGSDVSSNQLWFRHVGNDLQVNVIGTSDNITIANWYSGASQHVEKFKTGDSKVLLDSDVNSLVDAMAAFAPPGAGQTTLPSDYQQALLPVITSTWHGS